MCQVRVVLLGVDAAVLYDVVHSALKVASVTAQVVPGSCTSRHSAFRVLEFLTPVTPTYAAVRRPAELCSRAMRQASGHQLAPTTETVGT